MVKLKSLQYRRTSTIFCPSDCKCSKCQTAQDKKSNRRSDSRLLERVQSEPRLQENGTQFIISVTHLLERLLDYRQVVDGDENRDKRMHCTFNILNFYKHEINREEMYIRYVNKLHDLHMVAGNHAEAGLTLQSYAKILNWSDNILPEEMRYKSERERDRKEMLYMQIINCFDKGKVWEYALPLCKDLAEYYERNLDYKKLGDILKQQASFYQKILEGVPGEEQGEPDTFYPRQDPSYYRVSYYGQSFPAFVRNKQFIYRGDECLKLATIMNHLTAEFPTAQIMPNNDPPSEEIKNGEQQYVQICSVKPIPSERVEFHGKEVPVEIRNFYNYNEVDTFQFDRPYHRGVKDSLNESKTLCIERSKMRTTYKFPGILRWYEVTSVEVEMLCPIRVAIDQLKQNNIDLQVLITRCQHNPKLFFPQLEMKLNGNISASVQGGIAKYHDAFFTKDFEMKYPDEVIFLDQMKFLLHEQVKILQTGMQIHGRLVPDQLRPLHENLEVEFRKMKRAVSEHGSPYNSSVSLKSMGSERPGTPGSIGSSGRSSTYSQDEETSGVIHPGISSVLAGKTGSDPVLAATSSGSPQMNSGRLVGNVPRPAPRVSRRETFSVVGPLPHLPQKRRPSEFSIQPAPSIPTFSLPNGGPPPELPEKTGKKQNIMDKEPTVAPKPPASSHANKPVPPLPPRKGSDAGSSVSQGRNESENHIRPSRLSVKAVASELNVSHGSPTGQQKAHPTQNGRPPIPERTDKKSPSSVGHRISEVPEPI